MQGIICMTRWPGESANSYRRKFLSNPLSRFVKVQDIEHNFSPERVDAKILGKAEFYAEWHRMACNALRIDRSFCDVLPELQSVCECPRHTGSPRLRRRARGRDVSQLAGRGVAVRSV
jgi:hypothetical protein